MLTGLTRARMAGVQLPGGIGAAGAHRPGASAPRTREEVLEGLGALACDFEAARARGGGGRVVSLRLAQLQQANRAGDDLIATTCAEYFHLLRARCRHIGALRAEAKAAAPPPPATTPSAGPAPMKVPLPKALPPPFSGNVAEASGSVGTAPLKSPPAAASSATAPLKTAPQTAPKSDPCSRHNSVCL